MKKVFFVVIILLVVGGLFGEEFTFRGFAWGSSINDIIAKEGNPTYSDTYDGESMLTYENIKIAGTTAKLYYTFSKNGLVCAKYEIFYPDTRTPQKLYQSITLNLKSLYGRPVEEKYIPKGTLWGGGIDKFNVDIWSYSWVFLKTRISYIYQIDGDFSCGSINYESPEKNAFGGL